MKKILTLCTVLAFAFAMSMFTACPPPEPGPGGGEEGGDKGDTTPPTVVSVTPSGTEVSTSGSVVITFSEAIDVTKPGTVMWEDVSELPGTWDTAKKVYTIPYSDISPGVSITIKISGFKDAAGNAMTAAHTHTFTTVSSISANAKAGLYESSTTVSDTDTPLVAFDKTSATTATNTFNAAIAKANEKPLGSFILVLDGDVSLSTGSTLNTELRIVGKGEKRTISITSGSSLFTLSSSSKLILENNITLKGTASNTKALVNVNSSGSSLYMFKGSAITGNTNTSSSDQGGGVLVKEGYFYMIGGEIKDNKTTNTSSSGGGVYVDTNGTFIMSGGEISGNNTISTGSSGAIGGGGVYVNGTFTMEGGVIKGNTARMGAGVYLHVDGSSTKGTFEMKGGEISGNTVSKTDGDAWGGGVFIDEGCAFTMSGGKISGNKATSTNDDNDANGGGVCIIDGTFTMTGGEISGNTASTSGASGAIASGGGVYMGGTTFTMTGGEISGNTATGKWGEGGGVYVETDDGTFTMNGGKISGNTALGTSGSYGGGVYLYYRKGSFIMKNGEISGNTASGASETSHGGGGVYADGNGSVNYFSMRGGVISGNTAKCYGGGVYVDCAFTMTGGTIYGSSDSNTTLRNTTTLANKGAALANDYADLYYGKIGGDGYFVKTGEFPNQTYFEHTITVVNGVATY